MGDRPTKSELLEAVRRFLDEELLPELEGVRRFHARVASNALGIVAREIEQEAAVLPGRYAKLAELLGRIGDRPDAASLNLAELDAAVDELETVLCERIRRGDADRAPFRAEVLAYLRESVGQRLAVANPTYR